MPEKPKTIFIGTSDFAVPILEKLFATGYPLLVTITQPDRAVGRYQELKPPPVKGVALEYKIPVLQPEKIANRKSQIANLKPDLMIVADYGQIIPKEIFEIPKYGCLNVHPSLLPQYRGPSPIQTVILNGDKETGVTIMLLDEKMDHGPILNNNKLLITNNKITTPELEQKLAKLGGELLIEIIPKWLAGEIKPRPQDHSKATFTKTLTRDDGHIDWSKSAEEIERQIRAFTPWPGNFTLWKNKPRTFFSGEKVRGKRLKIFEARIETSKSPKNPGQTLLTSRRELTVACGRNNLILERLQLEGGKILSNKEFFRGHPNIINVILQ